MECGTPLSCEEKCGDERFDMPCMTVCEPNVCQCPHGKIRGADDKCYDSHEECPGKKSFLIDLLLLEILAKWLKFLWPFIRPKVGSNDIQSETFG